MFAACVFGVNVGPTAREFLSRMKCRRSKNCWYRTNVYQGIMELTNSEYTNRFIVYS
jgi:hypothetical protein